jgi:hypothetical protein
MRCGDESVRDRSLDVLAGQYHEDSDHALKLAGLHMAAASQKMDRYSRRRDPVNVEIAAHDGVLSTLEGPVSYHAGDALITGVKGERWPVEKLRFERTYEPVPPTHAGESGSYARLPNEVRACQMPAAFTVTTGGGDQLHGRPGDWLLEYGPGEEGVVAADVFAETYVRIDA